MKPTIQGREVTSTLKGERIDLELDSKSAVHLMSMFIDLYEDSEMAVLREYATNAFDAHIEGNVIEINGATRPIEITLPTPLEPTLKIRDWGEGLDLEDIREIYSKYGASTKRGSDEVVGSFGLGCKSALTYTDQFTVQAVKHGIRTIVAVSRDTEGAGTMTVVSEKPTDDPSGVVIAIPTKRYNTFAAKAEELFQYWPEGSVLVNGQAPKRFEAKPAIAGCDDLFFQANGTGYYDQQKPSTVVMGNVPYPVKISELGLDFGSRATQRIIAYVPIGSVEPQPSREGLRLTQKTKLTLSGLGARLKRDAAATAQKEVDKQPTAHEAAQAMEKLKADLPQTFWPEKWTYKGVEIPSEFKLDINVTEVDQYGYEKKRRGGFVTVGGNASGKEHSRHPALPIRTAINAHFFYGFEVDFTANHRKRLVQWYADNNLPSYGISVLVVDKPDSIFIDPTHIHKWEDVKNTKLAPTTHTEHGRLIGSYDAFVPGKSYAFQVLAADIDQDLPIYYYVGSERTSTHDKARATCAKPYIQAVSSEDCTVVLFAETRLAKFLRQFPDAKNVKDEVSSRYNAWVASLSDDQKMAMAYAVRGDSLFLSSLDPTRLDDPELHEAIRYAKMEKTRHVDIYISYRSLGYRLELPNIEDRMVQYPLISSYDFRRHEDHAYLYMNAVYNTHLKKGN